MKATVKMLQFSHQTQDSARHIRTATDGSTRTHLDTQQRKTGKEGYRKGGTCDLVAFDTSSMLLHYYVQENRIPIC